MTIRKLLDLPENASNEDAWAKIAELGEMRKNVEKAEAANRAFIKSARAVAKAIADKTGRSLDDAAEYLFKASLADVMKTLDGRVEFRKGESPMDRGLENLVVFAKMAIDQGRSTPSLEKHDYIEGINKRAVELYGNSQPRAFTKTITEDEIGRTLYRATKVASGPEVEPAEPEPPKKPVLGPAGHKMQALADDHLKANPHKSPAGAYSAVYTAPENAELRRQCIAEHMQKSLAAQAA